VGCREHPTYQAVRPPRASRNFPDKCPTCEKMWKSKDTKFIGIKFYCGICEIDNITDEYDICGDNCNGYSLGFCCPSCDTWLSVNAAY
jgi:hypothetical protein